MLSLIAGKKCSKGSLTEIVPIPGLQPSLGEFSPDMEDMDLLVFRAEPALVLHGEEHFSAP